MFQSESQQTEDPGRADASDPVQKQGKADVHTQQSGRRSSLSLAEESVFHLTQVFDYLDEAQPL